MVTVAGGVVGVGLGLLAAWGGGLAGGGPGRSRGEGHGPDHVACGTALVTRLWCPTCDRIVDDPEADELEHL